MVGMSPRACAPSSFSRAALYPFTYVCARQEQARALFDMQNGKHRLLAHVVKDCNTQRTVGSFSQFFVTHAPVYWAASHLLPMACLSIVVMVLLAARPWRPTHAVQPLASSPHSTVQRGPAGQDIQSHKEEEMLKADYHLPGVTRMDGLINNLSMRAQTHMSVCLGWRLRH